MADPVAHDVWRITTPLPFRPRSVHAYLARAGGRWVLVDGGADTDEAWAALDAGVRAVAGRWDAIELHVVTHMHVDHLGLAARVRKASGAALAMGRLDAERHAHATQHPDEEARYRETLLRENGAPSELAPAVPSAVPRGGGLTAHHLLPEAVADLPGGEGWRSVWTPGHTAGHISLFRPEDRVLVAGDAVLPTITPTIGVNRQRADPVADYLEALRRLAELRPSLALPGHGPPIADPARRLDALAEATREESVRVLSGVGADPAAAWQLTRARYRQRDLPDSAWMQALRETRAHLDHLAGRGDVVAERSGGLVRFRRA